MHDADDTSPLHIQTPLIEARALSAVAGRSVWLKMEALQPTGSFKLRGIGYACQAQARRGAKRLISSSGGNAGIAVAYAGRQLGLPVSVVVPESTSERAKTVHGASWSEANDRAFSMLGREDAFIHPFDDATIWQGHATMIDEVAASGLRP